MEPIAYLLHTFPQFSTTFINDEVDEMRRQGTRLALFAIRKPKESEFPPAFRRFREETTYVFPLRPARFLGRQLACLLSRPRRYSGLVLWILFRSGLSRKDRKRTLFHFLEAVQLYPEIQSRGCRHVHVHFLLGNASIAYFMRRLYGLPYSLTAHGSDIFVERVLHPEKLSGAEYIRVATQYNAKALRPSLSMDRDGDLETIPFGIDRHEIPPFKRAPSPEGIPRLLTVGRLIWQKAHFLLLDACSELVRAGLDFRLRIVGEGPLREAMERRIIANGLDGRVTLAGALPRSEVWKEYAQADLFVLSSVSEGSPIVLLEAMACGLPMVAPALHGIPEMFTDGVEGSFFEPGSAMALAETMGKLIRDATLRQRMGIASEISSRQFDHSLSVNRFRQSLLNRMENSAARLIERTLKESIHEHDA